MESEKNIQPQEKTTLKKQTNNYRKTILIILALMFAYFVGVQNGKQGTASDTKLNEAIVVNKDSNKDVDFSLFWKTWDLLKSKYVDSQTLDAQKLVYGAIKGMLQATGDPYTAFLDPNENKQFGEEISGNFEGIGAELGIKNGVLTVIAPLEGTPAEKAGIRAGDKIVKIDGKMTSDMSIDDAVSLIRGPKNTEVALTIFRNGSDETQEIKVQRNVINVKSVKMENKENSIAYIQISRFGEDTTKEFTDAINKVVAQRSKGLILDLRNDPGGYLNTSIDIASKLLPKNKVVVIEEDSKKNQKKMYTMGGDVASSIETVVLINEGSASASEILAGALKENRDNVTLIGKKSYGKGSVQEFIDLPQATAVKITVARWLTPNGEQINEQGIKPDEEITLSNDDYQNDRDPQLDVAIKKLKEKQTN